LGELAPSARVPYRLVFENGVAEEAKKNDASGTMKK